MSKYEQRAYAFEVRADESDGVITGRPIVYDTPTDIGGYFREIIVAGALNGTDLRDVPFLVNHDMKNIPLARSRRNNGNSTMFLSVDAEGMGIRVSLDVENNADARALYSAVKRGDISGMSFCFDVKSEQWDDIDSDYPTRRVQEIGKVYEVSAVTFPAYESTTITARSKEALDNARNALDKAKEHRDEKPLDKGINELELAKAKTLTIVGGLKK